MTKVIKLAKEMGISTLTDQDYNLSTALGGLTHGVTPLEMVQAYGVLANGGIKVQPTASLKLLIVTVKWWRKTPSKKNAL